MPADLAIPIRSAGPDDAAAVAALHTKSWRATYRGSLSDAYLDGPIEAERLAVWRERLSHPGAGLVTLVADGDRGALRGFVCCLHDHDPQWGSLIDNLHVEPERKGQGLGRVLMRALAHRLMQEPKRPPVYLYVLRSNIAAAGFYGRLGGAEVEHLVKTEPDGTPLPVARVAWPSLDAFAAGAG